MQKSIAVLLIAIAAMSCRHRKEETAATASTETAGGVAQSGSPLVGRTRKIDESSAPKHLGPEVGSDMPSAGAIVNVPALVGRSRERVNAVLGEPEDKEKGIYRVSGQPVKIYFDSRDRATWFEMDVPWPVLNAVDALRLLSVEAMNIVPEQESEEQVNYVIDFSGVELDGKTVSKLSAVATKPQTAAEWTAVGAGFRHP